MIEKVRQLEPKALWNYFADITQVPRPSGYKDRITAFMIDFATRQGLAWKQDATGNILISKPATPGMEQRKKLMLQGHVDMVAEKNSGIVHDFRKDPLKLILDGEWLKADSTTLGADNGIGLAAAMAVLADKELAHGPIEVLFTVEEETGMDGAFGLTPEFVEADILLNTDSEDEGVLFVGCAGGEDVIATLDYREESEVPQGDVALKLSITGLKGGHSGLDIHLGRGNGCKLLFRVLNDAVEEFEARIAWVEGGSVRNAIPREAFALITLPAESVDEFMELVDELDQLFKSEYKYTDPGVTFTAQPAALPSALQPVELQNDLIRVVLACKNGVEGMAAELPGVVETSSNLGVVRIKEGKVKLHLLVRSLSDSKKEALCLDLVSLFELADLNVQRTGAYPGWAPNIESPVLKLMTDSYRKLYHTEPQVSVIHAGLECGLIGAVNPRLDMVSFGPTLRHPHSPDEKVNIPSVQRFWDLLVEMVKNCV